MEVGSLLIAGSSMELEFELEESLQAASAKISDRANKILSIYQVVCKNSW